MNRTWSNTSAMRIIQNQGGAFKGKMVILPRQGIGLSACGALDYLLDRGYTLSKAYR
jgi:hypothetical protein